MTGGDGLSGVLFFYFVFLFILRVWHLRLPPPAFSSSAFRRISSTPFFASFFIVCGAKAES